MSARRRLVVDVVRVARDRCTIHGLIEVDVTGLPARLSAAAGRPTVTGFVIAMLARAVARCPEVNVRRAGRHVVAFSDVDVGVMVERRFGDEYVPVPLTVRAADTKSPADIAAELRAARTAAIDLPGAAVIGSLPSPVRRWGLRLLGRFPAAAARFGPAVGVTSLGMFGAGWGIPVSPLTVMVTIGGTTRRPVVGSSGFEEREYLPLTLSFDHSVIDGGPAARFTTAFRSLVERGNASGVSASRPAVEEAKH
jgi:pyruvate/2-oxoglutarate dehydrogenase complex dihydrolipoamide acyltransferase (E2) component